ncbi:MAG: hypothetical protein PSX80_08310 [bacterium]|nr:hypothetical protein [bacterium]
MYKVTFHDHVSVENREGVLDELASMGATIEVEAEEIYISTPKDIDEKFVRAFLLQEDQRGTLTVVPTSSSLD